MIYLLALALVVVGCANTAQAWSITISNGYFDCARYPHCVMTVEPYVWVEHNQRKARVEITQQLFTDAGDIFRLTEQKYLGRAIVKVAQEIRRDELLADMYMKGTR